MSFWKDFLNGVGMLFGVGSHTYTFEDRTDGEAIRGDWDNVCSDIRFALDSYGSTLLDNGTKVWYNSKGQFHRDGDLPAIIYTDGTKAWWKNGQLHREGDLPAVIYCNSTKLWYKDGLLHRDGELPAAIHPDGKKEYWVNGERIK